MRDPRTWLAVSLLVFQLGAIVYARFDPRRYYCWAPHDQQTTYAYEVRVGGQALTHAEAVARYGDPWWSTNPRAAEHVIRFARHYESTLGRGEDADVTLRYRVNGGPEQVWRWPEP